MRVSSFAPCPGPFRRNNSSERKQRIGTNLAEFTAQDFFDAINGMEERAAIDLQTPAAEFPVRSKQEVEAK